MYANSCLLTSGQVKVNSMDSLQFAILLVVSLLATVLNSFLFLLVYNNSNLRTRFNFTILNACLADVFVSWQFLILSIYSLVKGHSPRGTTECRILGFLHLYGFVGSVTGIAAVSFYRFVIICRPHVNAKYFSKLGTFLFNCSVWIFSMAISFPPLSGWGDFFYHSEMSICFVNWNKSISYMVFMITICFCGPIFMTLLSVVFILKKRRTIGFQPDINELSMNETVRLHAIEKRKKKQKVERKITHSILLVVIFFMVCWGPFVILMFMEAFSKYSIPEWIHATSIILGCLNSTINPAVYLTLNANFKKAAIRKLSAWFCYSTREEDTNMSSCSRN